MTQEEFEYIEKFSLEHCDNIQEFNEYIKRKNENQKFTEEDNKDACW